MKILAPFISCLVQAGVVEKDAPDELAQAIEQGYSQIYIQTSAGLFKHHILKPGKNGAARYVRIPVKDIPGVKLQEYGPDVRFLPDGKIPVALLDEIKAFFKEVIKIKGSAVEAMIWILWNQEKGYYLHVPNQVVSHASAKYDWDGLPKDSSIIVDIHSHADFSAFFSGTDNADDSNTVRYSGVIGHHNSAKQSMKWRFNYYGMKFDLEMEDIFTERVPEPIDVPKTWLDAVDVRSTTHGPNFPGSTNYGTRMDGGVRRVPGHIAGMIQHGFNFPEPDDERTGVPAANGKKLSGQQKTTSANEAGEPRRVTHGGRTFLETGSGYIEIPYSGPSADQKSQGGEKPKSQAITDHMEDRLHQAGRRAAEEDLLTQDDSLSRAAEDYLSYVSRVYEGIEDPVGVAYPVTRPGTGELISGNDDGPAGYDAALKGFDLDDIPPEFDEIAINHGVQVARAYAEIDRASTNLIGNESILSRSVENLFQLLDDDKKLPLFRTLQSLLPSKARDDLAQNGF